MAQNVSHNLPGQEQQKTPGLGASLVALPAQYLRVLSRPSAATFQREQALASWGSVWLQLLVWTAVLMALQYLTNVLKPLQLPASAGTASLSPAMLQSVQALNSPFSLLGTPVAFFLGVSVLFLLARIFGGQGTYLGQAYAVLLFGVPLVIVADLLNLIPLAGPWLFGLTHLYSLILCVFALMGVQRLNAWRAILVLLIPAAVALLATCGLLVAIVAATAH